jgi:lactate 2-monooxygenase
MPTPQYGDYQMEIYGAGLQGKQPRFPLDYASLEQAAAEVLPFWVYSYVGYGAGDGNTQRANVDAFSRYGNRAAHAGGCDRARPVGITV